MRVLNLLLPTSTIVLYQPKNSQQSTNIFLENLLHEDYRIIADRGSIHNVSEIPQSVRDIYRTAWEVPQRSIIDMVADRGPFIDQSQTEFTELVFDDPPMCSPCVKLIL